MERMFESFADRLEGVAPRERHARMKRRYPAARRRIEKPSRDAANARRTGLARRLRFARASPTCAVAHGCARSNRDPPERRFCRVAERALFGSAHLPRGLRAAFAGAYLYSYRCQDPGVARCAARARAGTVAMAATAGRAARKQGERRT
ncbi:hypothetical protein [Burkholderia sp. Bp9090]|uniref:hypothetical protein n=1 Tax=Burkholderia sp. Bp9090 TaxID=2184567 RepID=UPI000F5FEC31|nr:hypothetical protein [Burkholderia sp. Bp9090]